MPLKSINVKALNQYWCLSIIIVTLFTERMSCRMFWFLSWVFLRLVQNINKTFQGNQEIFRSGQKHWKIVRNLVKVHKKDKNATPRTLNLSKFLTPFYSLYRWLWKCICVLGKIKCNQRNDISMAPPLLDAFLRSYFHETFSLNRLIK